MNKIDSDMSVIKVGDVIKTNINLLYVTQIDGDTVHVKRRTDGSVHNNVIDMDILVDMKLDGAIHFRCSERICFVGTSVIVPVYSTVAIDISLYNKGVTILKSINGIKTIVPCCINCELISTCDQFNTRLPIDNRNTCVLSIDGKTIVNRFYRRI